MERRCTDGERRGEPDVAKKKYNRRRCVWFCGSAAACDQQYVQPPNDDGSESEKKQLIVRDGRAWIQRFPIPQPDGKKRLVLHTQSKIELLLLSIGGG